MELSKFRETLRKSVEATSRDMIKVSKKRLEEEPESDNYFNYEANYKAHLYHFLVSNGVSYENIQLESRPERAKVASNHIDLWYSDLDEGYYFLVEVKQVYGMNRKKDDIRAYDYRVRNPKNNKIISGIIKDVIKLSDSCGINKKFYGVMLMFWADPKVKENLNLDTLRSSILKQTREEKPGARTTRLEFLWSSSQRTEYKSLS
jgi:hypothetical protein